MLPMLDGENDTVTFAPKPERLKKYDVAFYQRGETGQLVLHRMIGFSKDGGYIFSGDNQFYYEYGVTDDGYPRPDDLVYPQRKDLSDKRSFVSLLYPPHDAQKAAETFRRKSVS